MQTEIMQSSPKLSPEQSWEVVLQRDRQFDDRLFYAVRTTGIYCRPSCPSRRPRRENVEFYFGCDSAERAGFRACLRCKPRQQRSASHEQELARQVCDYISKNLEGTLSLAVLGSQLGLSPFHLQRTFKKVMGISPRQYADARRLKVLKDIMRFGVPVTDAIYQAGYGSSRSVYERAPEQLGMTPSAYRRGGEGMEISYTVVDSALGKLLVAATTRGISSVCLGDSAAKLEQALFREYPRAGIKRDDGDLRERVRPILHYLAGKLPQLDLPLDVRATAFQWRVWQELKKIPSGSTRSYSQVARQIGNPKATRAVARACATNPVSLIVPCHRVVREDGNISGYRWGVERKRKLLAQEKKLAGSED